MLFHLVLNDKSADGFRNVLNFRGNDGILSILFLYQFTASNTIIPLDARATGSEKKMKYFRRRKPKSKQETMYKPILLFK